MARGVAGVLVVARSAVGGDDGGEGGCGGYEEGLHRQCEVTDYMEAGIGCVDC